MERSIGVVKSAFWPGVRFIDLDDLNRQARSWCEHLNGRVHATTHQPPLLRWQEETLRALPAGWAWERFAVEERRVSWEGYVSYVGVLYGLPSLPPLAGKVVQVGDRRGQLIIWCEGQTVLQVAKRARSRELVPHPDQFRTIPPAAATRRATLPLAHQVVTPVVAQRPLSEYDQLCGVEVAHA